MISTVCSEFKDLNNVFLVGYSRNTYSVFARNFSSLLKHPGSEFQTTSHPVLLGIYSTISPSISLCNGSFYSEFFFSPLIFHPKCTPQTTFHFLTSTLSHPSIRYRYELAVLPATSLWASLHICPHTNSSIAKSYSSGIEVAIHISKNFPFIHVNCERPSFKMKRAEAADCSCRLKNEYKTPIN